jgi:hypothetical protein
VKFALPAVLLAVALAIGGGVHRYTPPPAAAAAPARIPRAQVRDPPVLRAVLVSARQPDWAALFHATPSRFDLVEKAAQPAFHGDGAAQYYIARALARCDETNSLYESADDADQAVAHLAYAPALLELERQEYSNCRRFREQSPFTGLPARAGGYPSNYWQAGAVASGYPTAVVAAALASVDGPDPQVISRALASGNAEAMLLFGWTRVTADGASGAGSVIDAAWVFAACDGGADCGATNDVLPAPPCAPGVEPGCALSYNVVDELSASLKPEELEQARLLARNIEVDVRYHDPARLQKYLPF